MLVALFCFQQATTEISMSDPNDYYSGPLYVGALEFHGESPACHQDSKELKWGREYTRLLFEFTKNGWISLDQEISNPAELKQFYKKQRKEVVWRMPVAGELFAQIHSRKFNPEFYCGQGLQRVLSSKKINDLEMAEYIERLKELAKQKHILVSYADFKNPEQWQEGQLLPEDLQKANHFTMKHLDFVESCQPENLKMSLKVLKVYQSSEKDFIVALQENRKACDTDLLQEVEITPKDQTHWIYLAKGKPGFHIVMADRLMGFGDFNRDGKSEFLFWNEDHNFEEYRLFDSNNLRVLTYNWNFH